MQGVSGLMQALFTLKKGLFAYEAMYCGAFPVYVPGAILFPVRGFPVLFRDAKRLFGTGSGQEAAWPADRME